MNNWIWEFIVIITLAIGAIIATYGFVDPTSKWWIGLIIMVVGIMLGGAKLR